MKTFKQFLIEDNTMQLNINRNKIQRNANQISNNLRQIEASQKKIESYNKQLEVEVDKSSSKVKTGVMGTGAGDKTGSVFDTVVMSPRENTIRSMIDGEQKKIQELNDKNLKLQTEISRLSNI